MTMLDYPSTSWDNYRFRQQEVALLPKVINGSEPATIDMAETQVATSVEQQDGATLYDWAEEDEPNLYLPVHLRSSTFYRRLNTARQIREYNNRQFKELTANSSADVESYDFRILVALDRLYRATVRDMIKVASEEKPLEVSI